MEAKRAPRCQTLVMQPLDYSVRTMLETLAQAMEKQADARNKAADKAAEYAAKVRLILSMLKTEI